MSYVAPPCTPADNPPTRCAQTLIPIYLDVSVAELPKTSEWLGDIYGTTVQKREEAREHEALFKRGVVPPCCSAVAARAQLTAAHSY